MKFISGATSTSVRGGRNLILRYRGACPPGEKFSKKNSVFIIWSKKTAFFNSWRVNSVLNNIPNSYNNNGLFLCLKKHTSLYSFKMNDMSKLIKHVREAPKNFYSSSPSFIIQGNFHLSKYPNERFYRFFENIF